MVRIALPGATDTLLAHSAPSAIVAASISRVVAEHTDRVFGVMGNGNALVIDAVLRDGVEFHALRHEAGGVAAADAYARSSGRAGVATTTFGAGFTNTLTALTEAVHAHAPIVVITGAARASGPTSADVDIPALAASVGARVWTVGVDDAEQVTRAAFTVALSEGRPAVVTVPYDIVGEAAGASDARNASLAPPPRPRRDARPHELDVVGDLISGAKRLLIIAGRGAVRAGAQDHLRQIAHLTGAMTATTALAHGLFGDYRRHLGLAGGFGSRAAASVMQDADVVLVVGAGLNAHTLRHGSLFGTTAAVIQVDVLPEPTSPRVNYHVEADARLFARSLLDRIRAEGDQRREMWIGRSLSACGVRPLERRPSRSTRLHPQDVATAVGDALPSDARIVLDGGNFMAWPVNAWAPASVGDFVPAGLAFQSIGLGLAAMIGAASVDSARLTVLGIGDGGLMMSIADLESAIRLVRRGVIVVFNDSAYGAELHQYQDDGLETAPMRFPEVDFAGLARVLGARALTVRTAEELRSAATDITNHAEGVLLVDMRIADDVRAPFLDPHPRSTTEGGSVR